LFFFVVFMLLVYCFKDLLIQKAHASTLSDLITSGDRNEIQAWAKAQNLYTLNDDVANLSADQKHQLITTILDVDPVSTNPGLKTKVIAAMELLLAKRQLGFYVQVWSSTKFILSVGDRGGGNGWCGTIELFGSSSEMFIFRDTIAHESFHAFECQEIGDNGVTSPIREGIAIWVFKSAFNDYPPDEIKAGFAEGVYGTKKYALSRGEDLPFIAYTNTSSKFSSEVSYLMGIDPSHLPFLDNNLLIKCYNKYYKYLKWGTSEWNPGAAAAADKMRADPTCEDTETPTSTPTKPPTGGSANSCVDTGNESGAFRCSSGASCNTPTEERYTSQNSDCSNGGYCCKDIAKYNSSKLKKNDNVPPSTSNADLEMGTIIFKNSSTARFGPQEQVIAKVTVKNKGAGNIKESDNVKIYYFRNAPASGPLTANNSTGNVPLGALATGDETTKEITFTTPLQVNTPADPQYRFGAMVDFSGDPVDRNNSYRAAYYVEDNSNSGGAGTCSSSDIGHGQTTCSSGYTCQNEGGSPQCKAETGICSTAGGRISMSEGCDASHKWKEVWLCANGSQETNPVPAKDIQCTNALTPIPGSGNNCYEDKDGDGYGNPDKRVPCSGTTAGVAQTGDCNDDPAKDGAKVHKYQMDYSKVGYTKPGGGTSFDYNCDGNQEGVYKVSSLPSASSTCLTSKPGGHVGLNSSSDESKCGQPLDFRVCFVFESNDICKAAAPGVSGYGAVEANNERRCPPGGATSNWMVRNVASYGTIDPSGATQWCR